MVRQVLGRGLFAALLVLSAVPLSLIASVSLGTQPAYAQDSGAIKSIRVEGNKRVEPETVRSYLTFSSGDPYDPAKVDDSLKALFATGLFQDVRMRKEGSTLVVTLVENPIVNRVAFEGNKEIEDDTLATEVQLKPSIESFAVASLVRASICVPSRPCSVLDGSPRGSVQRFRRRFA